VPLAVLAEANGADDEALAARKGNLAIVFSDQLTVYTFHLYGSAQSKDGSEEQ
jgi:hypothetical protein